MGNSLKYIFSRICCRWCRVRRKKSEFFVDTSATSTTNVTLRDDIVGEEEYMPTQEVLFWHFSIFYAKCPKDHNLTYLFPHHPLALQGLWLIP